MTQDKALKLIAALRSGKTFATRHPEKSWGLGALDDGRFEKWSYHLHIDGGEEHATEVCDEGELVMFFMTWCGFDRINAGLQ